jgi:hypothetical protein
LRDNGQNATPLKETQMKTYVLEVGGEAVVAFRAKDDTDAADWIALQFCSARRSRYRAPSYLSRTSQVDGAKSDGGKPKRRCCFTGGQRLKSKNVKAAGSFME